MKLDRPYIKWQQTEITCTLFTDIRHSSSMQSVNYMHNFVFTAPSNTVNESVDATCNDVNVLIIAPVVSISVVICIVAIAEAIYICKR